MPNDTETPNHLLGDADQPACAYLLQEVQVFNNRVVWFLEQQQKQETFALGATGALWAYILNAKSVDFIVLLTLIPILVTVILGVKSLMLTKSMQESMSYLAVLEEKFDLDEDLGWVHFYRKNTSHYKKKWRNFFWISLFFINSFLSASYIFGKS